MLETTPTRWLWGFFSLDPEAETMRRHLLTICVNHEAPVPIDYFPDARDPFERVWQWAMLTHPVAKVISKALLDRLLAQESAERLLSMEIIKRERVGFNPRLIWMTRQ